MNTATAKTITEPTLLTSFRRSYPVNFGLYNKDAQEVLYIDNSSQGQVMHLTISNTSTETIALPLPSGEVSPSNYHFQLNFRPETLTEKSLKDITVQSPWSIMSSQNAIDGTVSLYLLNTSTSAQTIKAGDDLSIPLNNINIAPGGGTRGTRVELVYALQYGGSTDVFKGSRIRHVEIINRQGQRNIPLHIDFVGSNRVLNDKKSPNSLTLRITNVLPLSTEPSISSTIGFNDAGSKAPTKLIFSFDVQEEGETKEWALSTKSQVENISFTSPPDWSINQYTQGSTPTWVMTPQAPASLSAGSHIDIPLSGIISSLPTGQTNLYVHYENIPGYWDGQFVVVIEKAPLVFSKSNVGIGTTTPSVPLDVNGTVNVVDDLTIRGVSNGSAGLKFEGKSDSAGASIVYNQVGEVGRPNDGNLIFSTYRYRRYGTPSQLLEVMRINSNGFVEVKTDLAVDGVTSFAGGILNLQSVRIPEVDSGSPSAVFNSNVPILFRCIASDEIQFTFDLQKGAFTATGHKAFCIDHPLKENHSLVHACIEGPEVAVYYRGEGALTDGEATIHLPEYFEALTRKENRTVQLTAKGKIPFLLSYEDVVDGAFKVYGDLENGKFSWEVKAVRADVEELKVEVVKEGEQ